MLTTQALDAFGKFAKRSIRRAQYRVGSTWYDAPIVDIETISNGAVRFKSQIAHGSACTIAEVRLLDVENTVWAKKTVNVVIESANTNLLQWFDFIFTESEVN